MISEIVLQKWPTVVFTVFLTIFEYPESNAKLNYLCKGSNFTIQNWSRKSLENLSKTEVSASYEPVKDTYMLLCM